MWHTATQTNELLVAGFSLKSLSGPAEDVLFVRCGLLRALFLCRFSCFVPGRGRGDKCHSSHILITPLAAFPFAEVSYLLGTGALIMPPTSVVLEVHNLYKSQGEVVGLALPEP